MASLSPYGQFEANLMSNRKVIELLLQLMIAKGHGKNCIKVIKPHLVRHRLRNRQFSYTTQATVWKSNHQKFSLYDGLMTSRDYTHGFFPSTELLRFQTTAKPEPTPTSAKVPPKEPGTSTGTSGRYSFCFCNAAMTFQKRSIYLPSTTTMSKFQNFGDKV